MALDRLFDLARSGSPWTDFLTCRGRGRLGPIFLLVALGVALGRLFEVVICIRLRMPPLRMRGMRDLDVDAHLNILVHNHSFTALAASPAASAFMAPNKICMI